MWNNDMDVCLITGLYPKEMETTIREKSKYGIQNAANVFQWNILEGLAFSGIQHATVYNSMYIGSFPRKYAQMKIPSYRFKVAKAWEGLNIGFLNFPIIKEWLRYRSLKPHLRKWALDGNDQKCLLAYAATYPMVAALKYVRKLNPKIVTCLIVPDLPEYMDLSQKGVGFLHKIKNHIVQEKMEDATCYVLLTDQMKQRINSAQNKPCTILEGMVSSNNTETYEASQVIEKNGLLEDNYFLYTGTLNVQYGILDLVDAFMRMDNKNVQLVICGEGEASKTIIDKSKEDSRIHYLGNCSHDMVLQLQHFAMALINPRKNNEAYTKYSFPSKILEYLNSGRPTIAYMLDGMNSDYAQYLVCIQETPDGIKTAMEQVASMESEQRKQIGLNAQQFVQREKNSLTQMERVLNMLSCILEKRDEVSLH